LGPNNFFLENYEQNITKILKSASFEVIFIPIEQFAEKCFVQNSFSHFIFNDLLKIHSKKSIVCSIV
jgi:hypothetical protein